MAKRPKREWTKRTLRLKENHGWDCKPGYRIFVADRGSVRFDFPEGWVVQPQDDGSIKFLDKEPPDDDCVLQMSVFYLPDGVDWSGLTVRKLLAGLRDKQEKDILSRSEIHEIPRRDGHEIVWDETRFIDSGEKREARSRMCLGRRWNIQVLLTFAFWESDTARCKTVWDEVLRTLILGDYIEDPTCRVVD